MSVAARTADRATAPSVALARARVRAVPLLAALVAGSFLLRTAVGWLRATPTLFADEYIYAELARSLAETGRPLIRGASAGFPALLQPIVTAPAWLFEDVETSFRAVQTIGALAMSLAAVPVFLLARRLGLGSGVALALAALALAVPDLVYAGWVLAEPLAYPLVLAAVAAGTAALVRPQARLQLAFLLLAGLAVFARAQFAILPLCFLAAAAAAGLRERRLRAALREQALVLAAVVLPAVGLLALGPSRALGFYESALDGDRFTPELARWAGADAMILVFASGVVLVPGALLGFWLALRRPRSREELAFGALAAALVLGLLLEAAAWGVEGDRIQERYVFYAVPLLGIAFALYASRGWPHRLAHGALAALLVAVAAAVPLAGYSAADGLTNSPVLMAVGRLEVAFGDVGLASLVVSLTAAGLLGLLVLAARGGRTPTTAALATALAASAAVYAAAAVGGIENARSSRASVLGPSPSFVDESGLRDVAMLQSRLGDRGPADQYLFWNRSVTSVLLLPDGAPPDAFAVTRLTVAADGTLLADGEPVTRPLLADRYGATILFQDSPEVASAPLYRLVRASPGPHRLALYAPGLYDAGWLGLLGSIQLWPEEPGERLAGTLALDLTAPPGVERATVSFVPEGGAAEEIVLVAGASRTVSFPVCASGPWRVEFVAPSTGTVGGRNVSVQASAPVYRPDPSACPGRPLGGGHPEPPPADDANGKKRTRVAQNAPEL